MKGFHINHQGKDGFLFHFEVIDCMLYQVVSTEIAINLVGGKDCPYWNRESVPGCEYETTATVFSLMMQR